MNIQQYDMRMTMRFKLWFCPINWIMICTQQCLGSIYFDADPSHDPESALGQKNFLSFTDF